ncbi:MAG: hypothetical protein Q9197_002148 [Variospora fuerteventurae]
MTLDNMLRNADFIIVGGGTAGMVLANRLSEDPTLRVVVLECGRDISRDPRVRNPSDWMSLLGPETAWQLDTVPQPGLKGRVERQFQGKALGGSSTINGSAYLAPSRAGIEAWAKLGNPRWTYSTLLPYYERSYSIERPSAEICQAMGVDSVSNNDGPRAPNGPVQVSFPGLEQRNPLAKAWNDVLRVMGYRTSVEIFPTQNAGNRCYSAAIHPLTKERMSAASQYGSVAMERSNCVIVTEATVLKVILSSTSGGKVLAKGVEVSKDGQAHVIEANREVILSAGVFHTAKLLELSGIGETSRLEHLDILPVIENPNVGENLQNHIMCMCTYELEENVEIGDGIQTVASLPLHADVQQKIFGEAPPVLPVEQEAYNVRRAIFDSPDEASCSIFMSFIGRPDFASLGVMQSVPFSRGSSHIVSSRLDQDLSIDPRFFSNPLDLEIMANHLLTLQTIPSTSPLSAFFKKDGQRLPPGPAITSLESARNYLRDNAVTTHHSCGTAAMLPREKGGVVDQDLIVYGTKNLRIVDASIFPVIPQANPMSTVYAVAERAADLIKGIV